MEFSPHGSAKAIPDFDKLRSAETSYRRGYQQGAAMASRLMRSGLSIEEIEAWIYDDIAAWRMRKAGGYIPPMPGELAEVWE